MFLDLKDGFWHVNLSKDREKTALKTPFGLFEWLVMAFGLCNAPATFQALMAEILSDIRDFTSGLLDDTAIWGDTMEQLHQRLMLLFAQLARHGMILNTGKSKFVKKGVFLGLVISKDGIEVDLLKVAAISISVM
ncbi:hypothetical protein K3495_g3113 [Podosphaera aphanis]|nr:hypothetical protein K3495_g3113 [Podosphaera aphanis]